MFLFFAWLHSFFKRFYKVINFLALSKKEQAQAKDNVSVKSVPARLSEVSRFLNNKRFLKVYFFISLWLVYRLVLQARGINRKNSASCFSIVHCISCIIIVSRENDQSAITSSLRSYRPPVYHTKMGESR